MIQTLSISLYTTWHGSSRPHTNFMSCAKVEYLTLFLIVFRTVSCKGLYYLRRTVKILNNFKVQKNYLLSDMVYSPMLTIQHLFGQTEHQPQPVLRHVGRSQEEGAEEQLEPSRQELRYGVHREIAQCLPTLVLPSTFHAPLHAKLSSQPRQQPTHQLSLKFLVISKFWFLFWNL